MVFNGVVTLRLVNTCYCLIMNLQNLESRLQKNAYSVWVDVNDPSLTLTGRIIGDADGLDLNYSSFIVAIEDNAVILNQYLVQ